MNKTIIININGIVFHIEEDAYEVLKNYMTDIKRHFAYSADSEEIVTDIENRLAEMFNERLTPNKQVIILQDVKEVTAQMGSINDFSDQDEEGIAEESVSAKKLYRDPDDKTIAGVCSGIAHYFDIDVKWVRIAAVLSVLLSGTGLIIYAVLWLVVPEARTRQEKMAMKGEPINLQNFKKNFDDQVEAYKQSFNRRGFETSGDSIANFLNNLLDVLIKAIKVFVKVIGSLIIFAGSVTLIGLICGLLFLLGFWNNGDLNMLPFNAINPEFRSPIYFSAFLLAVVPLVALILFAARVLFNHKILSRIGAFSMLILWLTGLGMAVYYGSKLASEFKEEARIEQRSDLNAYPVYYLKLNPGRLLTHEDSLKLNANKVEGKILIDKHNRFDRLPHFDLRIEKSEDGKAVLIKEFKAEGKTFEAAVKNAQNSRYRFLQTDSTLTFDKYLYLTEQALFRNQRLDITLKIPVNTRLVIENGFDSHLKNYNLWECRQEESDDYKPGNWMMTNEGLVCIDSLSATAR